MGPILLTTSPITSWRALSSQKLTVTQAKTVLFSDPVLVWMAAPGPDRASGTKVTCWVFKEFLALIFLWRDKESTTKRAHGYDQSLPHTQGKKFGGLGEP